MSFGMTISRRSLFAVAAAAALVAAPAALAQSYPDRAITMIIPYEAGQGSDIGARLLIEGMEKHLPQSIIPENRGGGGANIGTGVAAQADPDGYTILFGGSGTHAANPALYSSLPFDPVEDFEPVFGLYQGGIVIAASPASGITSFEQFREQAGAASAAMDVALPSITTTAVAEMMRLRGGLNIVGVPYRGSAAAWVDVAGGRIPIIADTMTTLLSRIKNGEIVALAVSMEERSSFLPDVPTLKELGIDFSMATWTGLYVPKGTPQAAIDTLNAAANAALQEPGLVRFYEQTGNEPLGGTPDDFRARMMADIELWKDVVAATGLQQ